MAILHSVGSIGETTQKRLRNTTRRLNQLLVAIDNSTLSLHNNRSHLELLGRLVSENRDLITVRDIDEQTNGQTVGDSK